MADKSKLIEGKPPRYSPVSPLVIGIDESKDKDLSVVVTRQGDKVVDVQYIEPTPDAVEQMKLYAELAGIGGFGLVVITPKEELEKHAQMEFTVIDETVLIHKEINKAAVEAVEYKREGEQDE